MVIEPVRRGRVPYSVLEAQRDEARQMASDYAALVNDLRRDRASLAEQVRGLEWAHLQWPPIDGPWVQVVDRAAILAILEAPE